MTKKNLPIVDKNSRYVVSAAEMKRCDQATIDHFGIPQDVLMERAALSICKYVKKSLPAGGRVLIFAGSGNNGGDGIAAARILHQDDIPVVLVLVNHKLNEKAASSKRTKACEQQLKIALSYGVTVIDFDASSINNEIKRSSVIVDAMLGIGCTRDLEGDYKSAVCEINYSKEDFDEKAPHVISADIPTGINADTGQVQGHAICADETVTFGFLKMGCAFYPGAAHSGEIHIVNIGITDDGFLNEPPRFKYIDIPDVSEMAKLLLPKRNPAGNKGSFGKVLIAAGSKRISGACIMAAESCLRSGAGMVRVFTEKTNLSAVQTLLPEAMTDIYCEEDFDTNESEVFKAAKDNLLNALLWSDAVVCGPGIGKGKAGREILSIILENAKLPLVLDADALNIISDDEETRKLICGYEADMVMTPHLAEFSRLIDKNIHDCRLCMIDETIKLAKEFHACIICKDARSLITDGERCFINLSGNDGMATAGSGDVLAGLIGALVVSGFSNVTEAAAIGAYMHGVAGDMAAIKNGRQGMTARDISGGLRDIFSGQSNIL
ncbi:bifunctional ADP-dependent NAD(P)H-hydrate dehydratase/NAD(P)H-hydrate epimerase [Butyrivibrio sp. AE3004]|uniref:bifunctional ADP-dependent NAD(P)H-hydrate dehydratase/NAD(P)H-hydrate epimerase n=1 Tax=Butyrivibrio sp. AE3004 TaxID=1506994 RepID=UPI00068BF59D|nr:bifunctional ADP-dependent NAD(P)H-hydrate dehydratase/NAD(P)H-hydrate epimerase [Butyrivibrio sp. AE3004]